jgi:HEPN superfamily AbiU2-like protein
MTSDEYGRLLYRIREDVETAAAAFYTFQQINRFALASGENYGKLNRDAGFWNLQIHGLHIAYFMGLGRLFDKRSDVDSLIHLLDATEANPGTFFKEALAERKRRASGEANPESLARYLDGVWEPSVDDLRAIRKEVEPSIRVYRHKYAAIRHKVFAHSERNQQLIAEAVERTVVAEVDMMFLDLLEVVDTLHALFDNGVKHERRVGPHRFAREVRERTLQVLDRL